MTDGWGLVGSLGDDYTERVSSVLEVGGVTGDEGRGEGGRGEGSGQAPKRYLSQTLTSRH